MSTQSSSPLTGFSILEIERNGVAPQPKRKSIPLNFPNTKMPFSLSSFTNKSAATKKSAAAESALLEKYADYDIDSQKLARGERGIVVLSPGGDEPILAETEWYYTGKGNFEDKTDKTARKGPAKKNVKEAASKVELLFDAETPDEEKESFIANSPQ